MKTELVIPSLARMGVRRVTRPSEPDLITIYRTPWPVLKNYKSLCSDMGTEPFSGGSHVHQGPISVPGYITSGYRDDDDSSPHGFAVALDIATGDLTQQIRWGRRSLHYFNRVGLYPQNGFIHVDLFDDMNIKFYKKKRFWYRLNDVYVSFDTFDEMVAATEAAWRSVS